MPKKKPKKKVSDIEEARLSNAALYGLIGRLHGHLKLPQATPGEAQFIQVRQWLDDEIKLKQKSKRPF